MARFATSSATKASRAERPDTVNASGGEAHTQSPKLALASLVLTSMLSSRSTESAEGDMHKARALVAALDKAGDLRFAAQAALYARKVHGLRSIAHVVAGEIAHTKGAHPWKKAFFAAIVNRVDDAAEILAYYIATYLQGPVKWTLPNALRRGIAKALLRFDAYQLAKYQGNGKALSLVDVVNLCHPKAPVGHPLHDLMKGTLKAADTWETALSKAGTADDAAAVKSQEWARLLAERQLGYLAALRNIRNIIDQAPASVTALCDLLTDPVQVAKARIFPFQFNAAREVVMGLAGAPAQLALKAINQAMNLAVRNVPKLAGQTVVVVDGSGSMGDSENVKSPFGIASLFAAIILKTNATADLMLFSDHAAYVTVDTDDSVLSIQEAINRKRINGGTDFDSIFATLSKSYDRIIILSDMQSWITGTTPKAVLSNYMRLHKAKPFIYAFDLTGSGTMQFPETSTRVCALAGWSDKIFTVMENLEQDPGALVADIAKTEL